jgi:hypothetical protein
MAHSAEVVNGIRPSPFRQLTGTGSHIGSDRERFSTSLPFHMHVGNRVESRRVGRYRAQSRDFIVGQREGRRGQ